MAKPKKPRYTLIKGKYWIPTNPSRDPSPMEIRSLRAGRCDLGAPSALAVRGGAQ